MASSNTNGSTTNNSDDWHTLNISIPFGTAAHAEMARKVIAVDKILRSDTVSRALSVEGNNLKATFGAVSIRQARVALDHFFSDVQLVVDTIEQFDPVKIKQRERENLMSEADKKGEVEVGAT